MLLQNESQSVTANYLLLFKKRTTCPHSSRWHQGQHPPPTTTTTTTRASTTTSSYKVKCTEVSLSSLMTHNTHTALSHCWHSWTV